MLEQKREKGDPFFAKIKIVKYESYADMRCLMSV